MKYNLTIIVVLSALLSQVQAMFGSNEKPGAGLVKDGDDGNVYLLNDGDFAKTSFMTDYLVVYFYQDWCDHCKEFNPKFKEVANQIEDLDPPILMTKAHSPNVPQLLDEYQINSYPTIKIFKNGVYHTEYDGARDVQSIVLFLTGDTGSLSRKASCSKIRELRKKPDIQYLMISFGPVENNPLFDNIHIPLLKDKNYITFKHNDDEKCAKLLEVPFPCIAFIKKFETQIVTYTGEPNMVAFNEWRFPHMAPVVFKLEDYQNGVLEEKQPFVVIFRNEVDKDEDFMAEYEEAAREKRGIMYFAYQNMDTEFGMRIANFLQISRGNMPAMRAVLHGSYKFNPTLPARNVTSDQISAFVQSLQDQKADPYWKSIAPPRENDAPTLILTGNTYNKIVTDPTKEYVVWFLDLTDEKVLNWRALMFEFAEIYENITDVVFAELDQSENQPGGQSFPNQQLPQLIWFPKGEGKIPVYMNITEEGGNGFLQCHRWVLRKSEHLRSLPELFPGYIAKDMQGDDGEGWNRQWFDDRKKQEQIQSGELKSDTEQPTSVELNNEALRKGRLMDEKNEKTDL